MVVVGWDSCRRYCALSETGGFGHHRGKCINSGVLFLLLQAGNGCWTGQSPEAVDSAVSTMVHMSTVDCIVDSSYTVRMKTVKGVEEGLKSHQRQHFHGWNLLVHWKFIPCCVSHALYGCKQSREWKWDWKVTRDSVLRGETCWCTGSSFRVVLVMHFTDANSQGSGDEIEKPPGTVCYGVRLAGAH